MDLSLYRKRQSAYGGSTQVEKLDYRNKQLFHKALDTSFNSESVTLRGEDYRALVLDDKLTLDVDQKWIAMDNETGLIPGDVVHVHRNDSHWIMVQEDLNERSFRRCVGKRCITQVSWRDDEDIVHTSWAALRGPTETSLKTEARKHLIFERGNEKLALWLPDTDATVGLRRYKYLMVEGEVWEIASVDYFTTPGILELALVEAQDNDYLDNLVDNIARDDKFEYHTTFDKDIDFNIGDVISIEPMLMKNGIDITLEKEQDFEIMECSVDNYEYFPEHQMISFPTPGEIKLTIGYPKIKVFKEYTIAIKSGDANIDNYYIIQGDTDINPLINGKASYDIKHFENGVEANIIGGAWKFDNSYASETSSGTYFIELDFNGQTGQTTLEYIVRGQVVASRAITVRSIFG